MARFLWLAKLDEEEVSRGGNFFDLLPEEEEWRDSGEGETDR